MATLGFYDISKLFSTSHTTRQHDANRDFLTLFQIWVLDLFWHNFVCKIFKLNKRSPSVKNLQRNYDYVSPEENLGGRMYSFKLNWDWKYIQCIYFIFWHFSQAAPSCLPASWELYCAPMSLIWISQFRKKDVSNAKICILTDYEIGSIFLRT